MFVKPNFLLLLGYQQVDCYLDALTKNIILCISK